MNARPAISAVEGRTDPDHDVLKAVDEVRGLAPTVPDPDGDGETDALTLARNKLRLPNLRRVVKRAHHDALYDLELSDGTLIPLGPISHVRDPRRVEDAIGDALDDFPPYYGPKEFRPIARALLAVVELQDGGATPENLTRAWIEGYLSDGRGSRPCTVDGLTTDAEAVEDAEPFTDQDGRLYLGLPPFENYVRHVVRVPTTARDLAARLARLGFTNVQLEGPTPDGAKHGKRRRFWRAPDGFDAGSDT